MNIYGEINISIKFAHKDVYMYCILYDWRLNLEMVKRFLWSNTYIIHTYVHKYDHISKNDVYTVSVVSVCYK